MVQMLKPSSCSENPIHAGSHCHADCPPCQKALSRVCMLMCVGTSGVEAQHVAGHVGVDPGVGGCATREGKQPMQVHYGILDDGCVSMVVIQV